MNIESKRQQIKVGAARVISRAYLFVVFPPGLCPAVCEVNDEDKLNDDEHEAADHPEVHPGRPKAPVRDEECPNPSGDDDCVLETPETILNPGPGVAAAPHPDHEDRHEEKEEGDDKADPVDGEVAHCVHTLYLDVWDWAELSNTFNQS